MRRRSGAESVYWGEPGVVLLVNQTIGHSGPKTLAKCRRRGAIFVRGLVSIMVATFRPLMKVPRG
jgi:hypothetical protein